MIEPLCNCDQCAYERNKTKVFSLVEEELDSAVSRYAPMNSAHEGYAVILEEMDELKEEVWKSPKKRDMKAMQAEAVQVAAMAIRFLTDVCLKDEGEA